MKKIIALMLGVIAIIGIALFVVACGEQTPSELPGELTVPTTETTTTVNTTETTTTATTTAETTTKVEEYKLYFPKNSNQLTDAMYNMNITRIVDKGIIFTLSLVLSICESSEEDSINQFIENYISFLEEKIKQNINLEYNLLTKEDLLKLITLTKLKRVNETTKKTIIDFLTNLFKFNMKQMPISFLIKQLRHLIVQINNKEIDNYATNINFLTNIITFLQELVEKEKTTIQNDPYYVDKGFILNGRAPGGFQVNVIPELNKEFTMIFSFCCFSIDPSVEETPIFKFTNSKNEKLFYLYINKQRELCFDFKNTKDRKL